MKKKNKLLYDVILLAGVALVAFAGIKLYGHYAERAASDSLYEELNEQYVSKLVQTPPPVEESADMSVEGSADEGGSVEQTAGEQEPEIIETPWHDMIRVDFEDLKELNPDVVGWIFFENEDISYPVLYSGDNVRYLRRTLDGKNASAGSIFLDGDNTPDFEDSRCVIYGHNMKNLSMFGKIKYYREKEYYEEHQYFQILAEGVVYRYQIFSCFDVPETETEICRVDFGPDEDFSKFIDTLRKRSLMDTEIEVESDDKVVTLLTCYVTGRRTLVNAVRVDSYEIETEMRGGAE